jgi:tetratricopeptide (TPR) repeat protein
MKCAANKKIWLMQAREIRILFYFLIPIICLLNLGNAQNINPLYPLDENQIELNRKLELGMVLMVESKLDSAILVYSEALVVARNLGNVEQFGDIYYKLGGLLQFNGKFNQALELLNEAVLFEEDFPTDIKERIWTRLGSIYSEIGDYARASYYLFKALESSEKNKNSIEEVRALVGLGYNDYYQDNFDYALEFFQQGFDKTGRIKEIPIRREWEAVCLANIGVTNKELGQFSLAHENLDKALIILKEQNDVLLLAYLLLQKGNTCLLANDVGRALEYLERCIIISDSLNLQPLKAEALLRLGIAKSAEGNHVEAIQDLEIGYLLAKKIQKVQLESEFLLYLSESFSDINLNDRAFLFLKKHLQLKDSIQSIEKHQVVENLRLIYETQKKENEIVHLKASQKKNTLIILSLIISILLGLTVLRALFYRNRLFAKVNELLGAEKEIADLKIAALSLENIELERKAFSAMINPHFLFNSLNALQHFIQEERIQDGSSYLVKLSKFIRMILNSSDQSFLDLEEELERLRLYLKLEQMRFIKGFNFEFRLDPNLSIVDLSIPNMVIQPFVENAIWHGLLPSESPQKMLFIDVFEFNESHYGVSVIDNGVGIGKYQNLTNKGKHVPKGIKLCEDRFNYFSKLFETPFSIQIDDLSEIENYSKWKRGTRVTLLIPKEVEFPN